MPRTAVICVCVSASLAQAGVLIASHDATVHGTVGDPGSFALFPFFSLEDGNLPAPAGMLAAGPMTLADFVNGTHHALAGDAAAAFAALTDGADQTVYFGSTTDSGGLSQTAVMESSAFGGQPGVTGPDLDGFIVTEIRVLGTGFAQTSPTDFEATLQFSFYGERVPAPGAVLALGLAGALTGARRRR